MKKTFPILMILGLALSGTATVFALNNSIPNQVNAYSASSLPTTIKLNDNTETEIRNYYSSLNSLSASERQGNNLLKNLKEVLKNGQKYYSYDSGNAIWQIYEIADRDWVKSPASSISKSGTYNASNNTITGYKYSTNSNYSSYDNPYVHALYVNREGDNPMRAWGNHNQTEGGINREHIWPKSRGFDTEAKGGARGDPMHLWAADGKTNNTHSNWAYGYVDTKKSFTDVGATCNYTTYSLHGNYKGTSKTLKSGTVFEPQDSDKGDIARACFYMAARYNNWAGATSGIDSDDPNLTIENVTWGSGDTGTSTYNNSFSMGILSDLLEWNRLDPVDQYEIHRNNLLYNNYTNNRNPFIDFPQWADYIWGDPDNIGTPTGAADPSKNSINAKEPDPSSSSSESSSSQPSSESSSSEIPSSESSSSEIPSSSESSSQPSSSDSSQSSESSSSTFIEPALELSTTSLNLKPGESAKVSGISSDGSAIEWSTSDESIVSISTVGPVSSRQEVTITALKEGKATITASCDFPSGQNISKFIDVVVKEEAVPSSSSSTPASSSPESSQPPVSSSSSKQDFFSFFGCNSSISAFGIGGIAIIGAIASFVLFKKKKD